MGAVYVAQHQRLNRQVAVKVLLPQLGRNPEVRARFFREARAATDIGNEHIVEIIDFGELDDATSYIVMEWLHGQSLRDLLRQSGRLPIARALHIAEGIGTALQAAHAAGIVHRDLKPDNVFLVAHGGDPDFVKVLDFGIAKVTAGEADGFKTQTGELLGTPHYMSPEQCNGKAVDQRADVYALGVILYEMLTGELPFKGRTMGELLVAHVTQPVPPPRTVNPAIPEDLERVVMQALTKSPDERFGRMEALLGALRAAWAPPPAAPVMTSGGVPAAPVVPSGGVPMASGTDGFAATAFSGPFTPVTPVPTPAALAMPAALATPAALAAPVSGPPWPGGAPILQAPLTPTGAAQMVPVPPSARRASRTWIPILAVFGAVIAVGAVFVGRGSGAGNGPAAQPGIASGGGTSGNPTVDHGGTGGGVTSATTTPAQVCQAACAQMSSCGVLTDPGCPSTCEQRDDFRTCAVAAGSDCERMAQCGFRLTATNLCPSGGGIPAGSNSCNTVAGCENDCLLMGAPSSCICNCMSSLSPDRARELLADNVCALVRCPACNANGEGAACVQCVSQECGPQVADCMSH
jgi:tRNA A-37 threonylcarbamoyl transferase component Bud32